MSATIQEMRDTNSSIRATSPSSGSSPDRARMERSLDLVRQERLLEKLERSAARLEGCFEAGAFAPSAGRRLAGVDPGLQRAGAPKALGVGARHDAQRIERLPRIPAQTAMVPCGLLHEYGVRALDRLGNRHPHRPVVPFVEKDLDAAARFLPFRFPASRRGGTVAAQAVQDPLDVLAGPQTVGAMIPAPARVDVRAERTDLHRVAAAVR